MLLSISISIEDDLLQHIKDARSPKEAWDALVRIFSRTNDAKLKGLKNELLLIPQGEIWRWVTTLPKLRLCVKKSQIRTWNKIDKTRVRWIIIHGLRSKFNSVVIATRGWAKELNLIELNNILFNQEALDKKMSKVYQRWGVLTLKYITILGLVCTLFLMVFDYFKHSYG